MLVLLSSHLFLRVNAQHIAYPNIVVDSAKVSIFNVRIISLSPPTYSILPNQYMKALGYFCKQEVYLQKQTIIPIKFRLGTQVSCDLIEHH